MKRPIIRKEAHKKEDDTNKSFKNIISIGMIGNSKYIGISWSGLFQKFVM